MFPFWSENYIFGKICIMLNIPDKSVNFEFLRENFEDLYNCARRSEQSFANGDYKSSCSEAYIFLENLINEIYTRSNLEISDESSIFSKLENLKYLDYSSYNMMCKILSSGNKASQDSELEKIEFNEAIKNLNYVFILANLFCSKYLPSFDFHMEFKDPSGYLDKEYTDQSAEIRKNSILKTLKFCTCNYFVEQGNYDDNALHFPFYEFCEQYSLTDDQRELVRKLHAFFLSSGDDVFLMKGYAGTGKTYITKMIAEYLLTLKRNVVLMAPTGKAALVLGKRSGYMAHTIHKEIYCYDKIDESSLKKTSKSEVTSCASDELSWLYKFYFDSNDNIYDVNTVYIVDESSMVSDFRSEQETLLFGTGRLLFDLMNYINFNHNDHNKKIIFIGDPAQLPPVDKNCHTDVSPALDEQYLKNHYNISVSSFELRNVVRQKNEYCIYKNSIKLRESMERSMFNNMEFLKNDDDTIFVSFADFLPKYYEVTGGTVSRDTVVISYTNKEIAKFNNQIRNLLFNKKFSYDNEQENRLVLPIRENDVLMFRKNCHVQNELFRNGELIDVVYVDDDIEIFNITVINREKDKYKTVPLMFQNIAFKSRGHGLDDNIIFYGTFLVTHIYKSELIYEKEEFGDDDIEQAQYVFFKFRNPDLNLKKKPDSFEEVLFIDKYFNACRVSFGYAMTCHKAQGSEWDNVFVHFDKRHVNADRNSFKWMYTAITRASRHLYLIDPPQFKVASKIKFR